MAGALFVTKNSDWLKDQTGTMNENSPSAVLDDWSKSLSVGIPVSIISNSNGEPATGVVMCRVLKRSEGEVVFEATFPPQVLTDLTPNAVGIVVVEKKKKVFAPMGNVIWVGLSGEGIATPTVP